MRRVPAPAGGCLPWLFAAALLTALPARAGGLASVGWLAGCWQSESGDAGTVEHWLAPAGGTMLGVGRTVKAGKTVEYEFMQLRETADGRLVYIASPNGRAETSFAQLRLSDGEAAFENPEHDFPQRVIYRREGATRLLARIEGARGGQLRGVDFPMRRVACDAP